LALIKSLAIFRRLAIDQNLGNVQMAWQYSEGLAIYRSLGIDQNFGNIQEAWHWPKSWQYSGGLALIKGNI
jgi:hypothetical protein